MKILLFLALAVETCRGLAVSGGTASVLKDSLPMAWTSKLVYALADTLREARSGNIELIYPENFPEELRTRFKDNSLDFTSQDTYQDGMPFLEIAAFLDKNMEAVKQVRADNEDGDYVYECIEKLKASPDAEHFRLMTFRSIKGKKQCVYGIVKNNAEKRISVVFRGSTPVGNNLDWKFNLNSFLEKMDTPALLRNKLKGKDGERLFVHRGFYEYLFDNGQKVDDKGPERYERLIDDLKAIVKDGDKIWVTGHSLGAALSSLAAFALAGSDLDWLPKPITCVSFASPFVGVSNFRAAYERLEKDDMIRYVRFTNHNDAVPCLPAALSWRRFKHVGLNVRLYDDDVKIHHSSKSNFRNALDNSLFKPLWNESTEHLISLHEKRMMISADALSMSIEDLYNDKTIMG